MLGKSLRYSLVRSTTTARIRHDRLAAELSTTDRSLVDATAHARAAIRRASTLTLRRPVVEVAR